MRKWCRQCRKGFEAHRRQDHTCSDRNCQRLRINAGVRARRRERKTLRQCAWCATEYMPYRCNQKYCGNDCRKARDNAARRKYRPAATCRHCGAPFVKVANMQRYCSPECLGRHVWAHKRKFAEYNRPLTPKG